jgi:two-component system CheB/CheR fusion protein
MNAIPPFQVGVLIVDDCEDAADSLALLVKAWGYRTCVAYSGPEALRCAAVCLPDVVFLDVGMPVMSGWELAVALRQLPGMERAYLVVVSGFGQEADRARSRAAGCDLHLLKPVPPEDVKHLLLERQKEKQRHEPRTTDPLADRAWLASRPGGVH